LEQGITIPLWAWGTIADTAINRRVIDGHIRAEIGSRKITQKLALNDCWMGLGGPPPGQLAQAGSVDERCRRSLALATTVRLHPQQSGTAKRSRYSHPTDRISIGP
jgi:hypothetical protein